MNNKALFISEERYLRADIQGGVQLCTREYLHYLKLAGLDVEEFPVGVSINLFNRVRIKLGLDTYNHYDSAPYVTKLAEKINSAGIKYVFLNQLSLASWPAKLKQLIPAGVKFIGLSHGNESADYLNDITKPDKATFLQTWKLGRMLVMENAFFTGQLDGVIVLSEQEVGINQWLGAQNILYLPRILASNYIDWKPLPAVAGFAGTLDHLPNRLGIQYLADALMSAGFGGRLKLVGGPVVMGKAFASKYPFITYVGPIDDKQLIEEVKTWSLFINPVFWYARGASTKLAQAINWGLPCLTTPAGRRGYELSDTSLVTEDNRPETFAKTLIAVLSDEQKVTALKRATEQNLENFDIGKHTSRLMNFIYSLSTAEN